MYFRHFDFVKVVAVVVVAVVIVDVVVAEGVVVVKRQNIYCNPTMCATMNQLKR